MKPVIPSLRGISFVGLKTASGVFCGMIFEIPRKLGMTRTVFYSVAISLWFVSGVLADNWPQWRGPDGTGQCREKNLPVKWSADGENIRWKTSLPGPGMS